MKVVLISGQNHKGSTYRIGRMLADRLGGETTEFFLPRDFSDYCIGCGQCFMSSEEKCPHYEAQHKLVKAMDEADILILTSPVYVYHVTAPMKNFLDHQGHRWMIHRPKPEMFRKQAVCITTAAGAGMKSANKDMADSLFFWGVPKIYRLGFAIHALSWSRVTSEQKAQIEHKVNRLAEKLRGRVGHVRPGMKTKGFFYIMRMVQKKSQWSPADSAYWKEKGWLEDKRPWKED